MTHSILVIDQGTTSSRAIIFQNAKIISVVQQEFRQYFPHSAWVEHDPEEIWQTVKSCCQQVLKNSGISPKDIAAIGITNQRETIVAWDKQTGKPVYRAIVWQDRRTANYCEQLKEQGFEKVITKKTGLLLDPYFSASKVHWLFHHVAEVNQLAQRQQLAVGTIDSWLLWKLTNGQAHMTDITNASRTMLYNIHEQRWDDELLKLFNIPRHCLPEVKANCTQFGVTNCFGDDIPITAMIGDQQSALVGQACFEPGMIKSTYGTGCFMMVNTKEPLLSHNRLLTTIAYQIDDQIHYALEGSIFMAGATVQWLRDKLGIITSADETQAIAEQCDDTQGVYLVPAFTGLGAPHWQPEARAALVGMTRDTGKAEIITAALQSVVYQTNDLLTAMKNDGVTLDSLRVDGGMVANDWLLAFMADILDLSVERPAIIETTALGAAFLAGLTVGIYKNLQEISQCWQAQQAFYPKMLAESRQQLLFGWQTALEKVLQ